MPKISIILTSYNHMKYLRESIDSILNQTFHDFELIIVDDCSTDDSWKIIESYDDDRIVKYRHEKNMGDCLSRELIETLKGEYLAIAHCDDKWQLDKLEKQIAYLEEHKEVVACFTKVQLIDEDSNFFNDENHYYYKIFEQDNRNRFEWLNYFLYKGNCLCHPSILIRTSEFIEYELLTVGLYSIPDFYKWIKLCFHGEIYIYPERLSYFRIRVGGGNTSSDTDINRKRMRFEEQYILEEYEKNLTIDNLFLIFPNAKQYLIDERINIKFAFYQLLMKENHRKTYLLFALRGLYALINNRETAMEIEKLYGYSSKQFQLDYSVPDLFGEIKESNLMHASLYYDLGTGYDENNCLKHIIFVNNVDKFKLNFFIESNQLTGKLRFDPDEFIFRKFKDIEIKVNGNIVNYLSNANSSDEWDWFYTTDPIYEFQAKKEAQYLIEITGCTELIDLGLVDLYIKKILAERKKKIRIFK